MRARRLLSISLIVLVALAVTGCSKGGACSIAGANWPDHIGPFPPDGGPRRAELRLLADGTTEWNAIDLGLGNGWRPVGRAERQQLIGLLGELPMEPHLVVAVDPAANCETVGALADELDALPMCRAGRCLTDKAWENYSEL